MYGAVTSVLIDKWRPPTADAVRVGGWVYLKQIYQAFPLSPLPLPHFYFFGLLFTSHLSPLSERLEQATGMVRFIYPWCSAGALRPRSSAHKFLTLFKFLEFSLRTWKLIGHSTLGWFSKRTGTSVDNGACKSNNWLDQWQSGKLGTGSRV